jgi:hypothetical protein
MYPGMYGEEKVIRSLDVLARRNFPGDGVETDHSTLDSQELLPFEISCVHAMCNFSLKFVWCVVRALLRSFADCFATSCRPSSNL